MSRWSTDRFLGSEVTPYDKMRGTCHDTFVQTHQEGASCQARTWGDKLCPCRFIPCNKRYSGGGVCEGQMYKFSFAVNVKPLFKNNI